ncbi:MAG TPA: PQQ-binding-like beta-propeller repeat protein [Rhizomicrobium sp.]|nr:PQQ-binding-like beta-propeller repeat protein [Rhizomicrobium sp.]
MIKGRGKHSNRAFIAFGVAITLGAVSAASLSASGAVAQNTTVAGPFTDTQAQAGQAVYNSRCAACHDAGGETTRLQGASFTDAWKARTTRDLYTRIKTTMPFNDPGSLSDAAAASVVAYILKSNGAVAGTADFTPATAVAINTIIADGPPQRAAQARGNQAADPYAGYVSLSGMPAGTGITVPGTAAKYTPVTEEMLLHPPAADWLMHYQNYAGWSHSPLKQINAKNVHNLQLRWVWSLDDGERQQITPLVHDGVMFISTVINNKVQALNAATGDLIWENSLGPRLENQVNATARAMALYGNQLFYPASDATLYALDARTGKVNWKFKFSSYGRDKIGGLMIADGKLIVGRGVCDEPSLDDRCFIAAYDVRDGHQIWKFSTVAYAGEPGGDSWGDMTNGQRAGADAWIAGTYDPKLRLIYWGTGQAKAGKNGIGDKLFSNATIALDVDTGALKWFHQPAPDEGLDLDEVYEKVLVDEGSQKILLTAGKKGILWKIDRTNGKFLGYVPMVFQNVFTSIDLKTGRGTYRADILHPEPGGSRPSCPAQSGGHNWPASSYIPEDDLIIFPLDQICVTSQGDMIGNFEAPASDGNMGRLSAYRAKDLKPVWTLQQRAPFLTSSMTTAGGIGFVGDWDRTFRAFDVKTGKTLWTTRLGTTAQGFPTTFSVGGEQFVAVPTGYNGGSPEIRPSSMFAFERNRPLVGHAVYVFALPKAQKAGNPK